MKTGGRTVVHHGLIDANLKEKIYRLNDDRRPYLEIKPDGKGLVLSLQNQ